MKRIRLEDLPPEVRKRVIAEAQVAAPASMPADETAWQGKEQELQKLVEQWLDTMGFAKRNKRTIESTLGKGGRRGWQLHVKNSMLNPYTLDLILLGHDGRWLEIELKTAKGKLSPTQALLLGERVPCRSLGDVQKVVGEWISEGGS